MKKYDLVFIGHMCRDEIIDPQGNKTVSVGSAVLCGAYSERMDALQIKD